MRIVFLCLLIAMTGCFSKGKKSSTAKQTAPVVTPDFKAMGKIVMFNDQARFAVVNFPFGVLPKASHPLAVYRKGLKVGELRSTEQHNGNNVVADLMTGSAQKDDEVREE
jgi:hypothetical protein